MRVSSHQPSLLPWSGFWHKYWSSDLHIVSAGVLMDRQGYQNRVPFADGWLTAPVSKDAKHKLIFDVRLAEGFTPLQLIATIRGRIAVKKLPALRRDRIEHLLGSLEKAPATWLTEFTLHLIHAIDEILETTPPILVTDTKMVKAVDKTQRLFERVCRNVVDSHEYLAGGGARDYLNVDFVPKGVVVSVQKKTGDLHGGSILQLIAEHDDPVAQVMGAFTWEPL